MLEYSTKYLKVFSSLAQSLERMKMAMLIFDLSESEMAFFSCKKIPSRLNSAQVMRALGCVCVLLYIYASFMYPKSIHFSLGTLEKKSWSNDNTLSSRTVFDSAYLRVESHTILGNDGSTIHDWMWTETPDHVVILVEVHDGSFLVFEQTKYGIKGKTLAVVGGGIEKGETPLQCAHRELLEETGLETSQMEFLGTYRVDANRGGGFVTCFFARQCMRATQSRFSDDLEPQKKLYLSRAELRNALLQFEFGEVKWTAAIALALVKSEV